MMARELVAVCAALDECRTHQLRFFFPADVGGVRAAGREPAPHQLASEVRGQARDRVEPLCLVLVQVGDRGQEGLGVRVAHVAEQRLCPGGFYDPAGIHDHDPVRVAHDHVDNAL